jgi:hypothetical protein
MKHTITLLFLLLTTISFAQIPSYVPSNGLVGWWPFNGNANDESGNGNNGTVNGASLTVDRFGVADKAYSFDGVNDFIEVQDDFNLDLIVDFTISSWIKPNSFGLVNMILSKHDVSLGTNAGTYAMGLWQDANLSLVNFQAAPNFNPLTYPSSTGAIDLNYWQNFTVKYIKSTNSLSYFINGNLVFSTNILFEIDDTNQPLKIGTNTNGSSNINLFSGSLDDIGIWNRALTACEIKDLYYAQLGYSTVDAGADQTICKGDLVTLQGAGGSSLAWDNGVIDGVPFEPAQSGAYVLTGADSLGCIGTDTVQVTVLENASSTINQTAIDSYTLNGQTYTQSGTYTQVVPAANGCDSVITLNLELDFTGIQSHTNTSLQLYPNPVKDIMTLVGLKGEAVSFAVYSVDGKLIKSGQTSGEIQLEDLKKGNYILKIENEALPFVKL